MLSRIKYHLWTLPRWFAIPFFGCSALLGAILAGSNLSSLNTWLGFLTVAFIMACGHSMNSFLDYYWTGLDQGTVEERSAEKKYTGGQNLLATGKISYYELIGNIALWYALAGIVSIFLGFLTKSPVVSILALSGAIIIPVWYSWGKFNLTHELSLGVGVGPLSLLIGMFAINPNPNWLQGILISIPFAIVLSFAGLPIDEWPDYKANLAKGVKSISFRLHTTTVSVYSYVMSWVVIMFLYQFMLVYLGWIKPLTMITLLIFPLVSFTIVLAHENFDKYAHWVVIWAALYPILFLIGQIFGR